MSRYPNVYPDEVVDEVRAARSAGSGWGSIAKVYGVTDWDARVMCADVVPHPSSRERYPIGPLLQVLDDLELTQSSVWKLYGVELARSMAEGGCTEVIADLVATRLHMHPSDIWGELWWERAGVERTSAAAA